ncbi:MAG: type IV pilin N-terminal domain-containing protein [Natronomonas sp.]|uniref:type IV pilin N-terminal domain-containing protein n=1 Tax=Natronomonas sp. TaxID=2184060 RepID=UPI0028707289|nr:type IV pilin N-terminal domain-containing protein [Natronomonas sp.]MDR9382139.1 type IV pilin N-terminal domain-containing protein [Natronomonas sp.]MDR9430023.1 type IV pilin N-terminal domain-containing protein [Natronomonas sp.]
MRDSAAVAVLLVAVAAAVGGLWFVTADLPDAETPNATFEVTGDASAGELTVEHAGGDSVASESLRILVYEDRPIVPDRTVHGTIWGTDTGMIQPGDRIALEDRRFDDRQRLVVRWFGDGGQATIYETTI